MPYAVIDILFRWVTNLIDFGYTCDDLGQLKKQFNLNNVVNDANLIKYLDLFSYSVSFLEKWLNF